jgi:hypothetical protein
VVAGPERTARAFSLGTTQQGHNQQRQRMKAQREEPFRLAESTSGGRLTMRWGHAFHRSACEYAEGSGSPDRLAVLWPLGEWHPVGFPLRLASLRMLRRTPGKSNGSVTSFV